jgi:type II secretory pathway pseudopilin PulG
MFVTSAKRFRRLSDESGQQLVELLVAMIILAVALTALLGLLVSAMLSIQRTSVRGTATALADQRLELYRTLSYANIRLNSSAVSGLSATSAYVTAHAADSSIPSATGEVVCGGTAPDGSTEITCVASPPTETQPVLTHQLGPDKRYYEIDTYISYVPAGTTGRASKQVMVVVRAEWNGLRIVGRSSSSFDRSIGATG